MARHLIVFGHGEGDPGCQYNGLKEADYVRKLQPYIDKWGAHVSDDIVCYVGNMYGRRSAPSITGYDSVTSLHLDAPQGAGGHVIIHSDYEADEADKRIMALVKKYFGFVGYLPSGLSKRNDLYNLNVFKNKGISYRLIEWFFLSNDEDRKTYDDNLDNIARELIEAITGQSIQTAKPAPKPSVKRPNLTATAHIQTAGWVGAKDGMIGSTGQSRRLEAFFIAIDGKPVNGTVHIQGAGDTAGTGIFGTVGMARRIEGVSLEVPAGVQYRVHIQDTGWTEWVNSGEYAGTKGKSKRIEAIEFKVK